MSTPFSNVFTIAQKEGNRIALGYLVRNDLLKSSVLIFCTECQIVDFVRCNTTRSGHIRLVEAGANVSVNVKG